MVPEIMIPLVGEVKELKYVKDVVVKTADEEHGRGRYADEVSGRHDDRDPARGADRRSRSPTEAEFFSFGTNDLTQMTFGFSRDDAGKFLDAYYDKKIYENDPFAKLDQTGVGKLVEMACKLGRATRPDLHLGICGEHGGDPLQRGVLPHASVWTMCPAPRSVCPSPASPPRRQPSANSANKKPDANSVGKTTDINTVTQSLWMV